jgi:hypothetical protein
MLASTADLADLTLVVKLLISAGIPCAVCKDAAHQGLSVWVQRDADLPLALRVASNRPGRPRPPHWVSVLEFAEPGPVVSALRVTKQKETAPGPIVQVQPPMRTETGHGTPDPQRVGTAAWLLPPPDTATHPAVDTADLLCLESISQQAEGQRLVNSGS